MAKSWNIANSTSSTIISEDNEELIEALALISGKTKSEIREQIKEHNSKQGRKVVRIWKYGDDPKNYALDEEAAKILAATTGHSVVPSMAWKDAEGKIEEMTSDDMREYFSTHSLSEEE